jgi:hypothetical protein
VAEDAPINLPISAFRPAHEQLDAGGSTARDRRPPGVVYGGGSGIVGDIFKSASNGLVRVATATTLAAGLRPRPRRSLRGWWPA